MKKLAVHAVQRIDKILSEKAVEVTHVPAQLIALPGFEGLLSGGGWMVSPNSSRLGIRLLGKVPDLGVLEASRPSAPGVIQASSSGELLVHGPDGPTTGGYPQLGAVMKADLGRLSELPPGARTSFTVVTKEAAISAWNERVSHAEQLSDTLAKLKRLGLV